MRLAPSSRGRRTPSPARSLALALALALAGAGALTTACRRPAPEETTPRGASMPQAPHDEDAPGGEEMGASVEPAITGVRLGQPAPADGVKMLSVDGRQVSLSDARGAKGLLVVFTCNACPYARAWEQRIVALGNEYLEHGVGVIAVNANDPAVVPEDGLETMKARAAERGMKYPYVVDSTSEVARAFGATRTPEAFLFGADGKLAYHGTIDDNAQAPDQVTARYLRDALAAIVAGQPVPVPETKSLGCAIKFRASAG